MTCVRNVAIVLVIVITASLGGCAPSGRVRTTTDATPQASATTCTVELVRDAPPTRPFKVLGSVGAHSRIGFFAGSSEEAVMETLRRQACNLGADAVIGVVETRHSRFEWTELDVSGTAIAFTDQPGGTR